MSSTNGRQHGEFLSRLGILIVIQVAFIFAALALVIYLPGTDYDADQVMARFEHQCRHIGENIAAEVEFELSASVADGLDAVEVFAFDSLGGIDRREWVRSGTSGKHLTNALAARPSREELQALLRQPDGFGYTMLDLSGHLIGIRRISFPDGTPALARAVSADGLFVTAENYLTGVLMVLFAASSIVSILLVLLMRRHFLKPLRRLRRGMEKTASGELYVLPEHLDDAELDSVARSFNSMSRSLLDNQQRLRNANHRLNGIGASLLQSQLSLATLIDSTPLCIIVATPDGDVTLVNRQACEDFGYTSEEAAATSINDFFADLSRRRSSEAPFSSDGSGFEVVCRRSTGAQFPAYLISRPIRSGDGSILAYLYIIKDISESASFQDMMIRLDRYYTRGEMAGDIAHEINNYLSILLGNIELMPLLLKKGKQEKIDQKLELMRDTTTKIAGFTDGLMDGHADETEFVAADLNQLVLNVLAFLKPQNRFDGITIESDLSDAMPLVEIDSSQIQQLLVNLVYNAAEALEGRERERTVGISTSIRRDSRGRQAVIEVSDNGTGVAGDKIRLLFEKRFTTKRKGHGIGLVTCRQISDNHGGHIEYAYRDGAVFTVWLPVTQGGSASNDESEPVPLVAETTLDE